MSKNATEYKLAIRIAGQVDKSLGSSLAKADTALKGSASSWTNAFNQLDKGYDKIISAGKKVVSVASKAATVATTAVVAATVAAVNAGVEFESAFAGVKKTVDATEEQFAELRQGILDMSEEIPATANEIAKVMEVAGQLGISTDNLMEFTRVMIDLGVSTNLSAEEAATALAKFANITQMDPADYEKLGSTIVDLGNNFATTELDIVEMATNLAASGELVGLTEAQIMALSTAMSSVGIASERGGSTMSKLLKKMQIAVETNGKALEHYASVADMSASEFAAAFKDDAVVALSAFIDGINDTERNGKSAIVILEEMGLNEIRLSNTILALAGAEGLMTDAIQTANSAWDENTALAVEAGRRYETMESKMQMLKNSFYKLGVAAYDELREPLGDAISWLSDKVSEFSAYLTGSNGISKWIKTIKTALPTVIRQVKEFGAAILKLASPLLNLGKWLIKHPDFLATAFIALGSALVAYKIVSTVASIVANFNVLTLVIGACVAVIGVAVGLFYSFRKEAKRLQEYRLDQLFGDIALSLEDIQEIADYLVNGDGSLDKLRDSLAAFDDLSEISTNIADALKTIKKSNWKVSIGMELSEEEKGEYKESIDSYISNCLDYVTQKQYAVTLTLNAILDDDSLANSDIVSQINNFYSNKYTELEELGKKLNETITEAFTDGLLDMDEVKEITELQAQMSRIQQALANSNFEAALQGLSFKYGSASELDKESFFNLQTEVNSAIETATADYREARDELFAVEAMMLSDGAITQSEYDANVRTIQEDYLNKIAQLQARATEFLADGILDTGVIDDALTTTKELVDAALSEFMSDGYTYSWSEKPYIMWTEMIGGVSQKPFEDAQSDVAVLLERMEGTIAELKATRDEYEKLDIEIPDNLADILEKIELLEGFAYGGDSYIYDVLYDMFNSGIEAGWDSEGYGEIIEMLQEKAVEWGYDASAFILDGIADGTVNSNSTIKEAIDNLYSEANNHLTTLPPLNMRVVPSLGGLNFSDPLGIMKGSSLGILAGHADGGIFTVPHIAAFAEKGPESAIPLDGSANAINLWKRTGQLLGMGSVLDDVDLGGNQGAHIEYSPTLVFNGDAPNQNDLESAMAMSQDRFEQMMSKYIKDHGRFAF